jgi:catechol 2,3-dioxygenase-like lactoylglutathione lyase family enzyme
MRFFLSRLVGALLLVSPAFAAEHAKPASEAIVPWNAPVLLVRDLDRSAAWYEERFGFQRVEDRLDGTSRSIVLSRGFTFVHLRAQAADVTGRGDETDLDSRPPLTLLVDDVDAVARALTEDEVELVAMPQDDSDGRRRTAIVADPDGNPIAIQEILPPGT